MLPKIQVEVSGRDFIEKAGLGNVLNPQTVRWMNERIGDFLVRRMARYISDRSKTRHKTADRLGAAHTGVLEFSNSNPSHNRRRGVIRHVVRSGRAEIVIERVEGLTRAFHALSIHPRRASALTIPINRESYAKTTKDMRKLGWFLFRPKGTDTLWGMKDGASIPLYKLMSHTTVPRDAKLMPTEHMIGQWANKAGNDYIMEKLKK